jgi:hypothetical protein
MAGRAAHGNSAVSKGEKTHSPYERVRQLYVDGASDQRGQMYLLPSQVEQKS